MWADRCHVAMGPSSRHAYKPIQTCRRQEGVSSRDSKALGKRGGVLQAEPSESNVTSSAGLS